MARGRSGGRGTRLNKQWFASTFGKTTVSVTQAALASINVAEGGQDATILRSRGDLLVTAVPNAAADDTLVHLGLIVVQRNAVDVGGVSLPGPLADVDADWLWWRAIPMASIAATAATENSRNLVMRVEIDSKGMRKMDTDESLVLMGEDVTGEMAAVTVTGSLRVLLGF